MFFSITGEVSSKKNENRFNKATGRVFKSDRFRQWHSSAMFQLKTQEKPQQPIDDSVKVSVTFYHGDLRRRDGDNGLSVLASFLDKIRVSFGKTIRVNCAFRSDAVNGAVGGAKTSAHLKGLAADICAWSGTETDNRALLKVLEANLSKVDQLISYHEKQGEKDSKIRFIHVGLCDCFPRMQRLCK